MAWRTTPLATATRRAAIGNNPLQIANNGTLLYRFTVEDPSTWARPWTGEYSWAAAKSDDHLYEYACHEGNYAFEGIMKGERLLDDERAATQSRQQ